MKAYVLSIAGIVLVIAALTIIAPNGKMGKFIKGAGRLFIIVIMVAPFVSFFADKNNSLFETEEIVIDSGYLESCAKMLENDDEEEITAYLSEELFIRAEVKVSRSGRTGFPREKIEVKIIEMGINGQVGHIDKAEDVRKVLEERYGCEAVVQ